MISLKIVHIILAVTLAVLIFGPFSGLALAQQGNPRFPVNVTLGPVSPPPGASFTPKYPGEFKATPPPGMNASVTPKATMKPTATMKPKVTMKPTITMKPTVKPTVTVKHKMKPSVTARPSVTHRPLFAAAHKPTPTPTVKPKASAR